MYRKTITINPAAPNFPLDPVWVGVNSDALFVLSGVPAGHTARLYVTRVGASAAVWFACSVSDDGEVYAHVPGANFPAAGQGSYEVRHIDDEGRSYWAGRGLLTVETASSGTVTAGYGNALETYIRNPSTGLYHRVWAEINDDGDITTHTDPQGVQLA